MYRDYEETKERTRCGSKKEVPRGGEMVTEIGTILHSKNVCVQVEQCFSSFLVRQKTCSVLQNQLQVSFLTRYVRYWCQLFTTDVFTCQETEPNGSMNLIASLRTGNFRVYVSTKLNQRGLRASSFI